MPKEVQLFSPTATALLLPNLVGTSKFMMSSTGPSFIVPATPVPPPVKLEHNIHFNPYLFSPGAMNVNR